ncbi:MAG: tetratricopeptide repeat protein [Treponema sp.]|jgi:tetratricopeptide (TPR) repeat protein|nr:tetratricopeptide repeat protein [Treponema sp.]
MEKNIKIFLITVLIAVGTFNCFASELYERAFSAYKNNRPKEAQSLFLQVLEAEGEDASVYNYLGVTYYQTGDYEKSIEAFVKGTSVPFANRAMLYFNAGNSAFALNDFVRAEKFYTSSIAADSKYSSAYLNRANTRVKTEKYKDALVDYESYLKLVPDSLQKDSIEAMMRMLEKQ